MSDSFFIAAKKQLAKTWKVIAIIVSAGTSITALNVKIHLAAKEAAQQEVGNAVRQAVKDALFDVNARVMRAENLIIGDELAIARLEGRLTNIEMRKAGN